jgi:predicted deacylase
MAKRASGIKKTVWIGLAGFFVTAFLFAFAVMPGSAGSLQAAERLSTRWPTVTRHPTDTRWLLRPTNTRIRTSTLRPTSTRWPTKTKTPTRTRTASPTSRFSLTPSFTPSPTITYTNTVTPSQTFTPSATPAPSLSPIETLTPLPFSEGPITIGYSVQNRPLQVYRFGTGPTERLIIAGIHGGNEYNTVLLADQLMAQIKSNPGMLPPDVTLYVLRLLNPDGAARALSPDGRANANGVDLNRNWPVNWKKTWPLAGCWTTPPVTGGTGPASEPETQALMAFIQAHHFDALIDYHSAYLGIFPGGIPDFPPSDRLAEAVSAVSPYSYPPVNSGCVYTGGLVDWTSAQGIASLDLELTDHTHTDYAINLRVLNVLLTWKP